MFTTKRNFSRNIQNLSRHRFLYFQSAKNFYPMNPNPVNGLYKTLNHQEEKSL